MEISDVTRKLVPSIAACAALAACAEPGERAYGPECRSGLRSANATLSTAKADGLAASAHWAKAASLLGAARVQKEFGEYQNCVIKVREAQAELRALAAE